MGLPLKILLNFLENLSFMWTRFLIQNSWTLFLLGVFQSGNFAMCFLTISSVMLILSLPIQINLVCHSTVLHFPCDTSLHSWYYSQVFLGCYLLMISAKIVDLLLHIFSVICWRKSYLTMLSISSWLFSTNGICTRINPLSFLFAL